MSCSVVEEASKAFEKAVGKNNYTCKDEYMKGLINDAIK